MKTNMIAIKIHSKQPKIYVTVNYSLVPKEIVYSIASDMSKIKKKCDLICFN